MTDQDTETGNDAAELSFGAAMQELESILQRVESEETDIDELAEELKRAAELLEVCRGKIRRAEVEVSQIVQNLERPGASETDPEPTTAEPSEPEPSEAESPRGETANLFDTSD